MTLPTYNGEEHTDDMGMPIDKKVAEAKFHAKSSKGDDVIVPGQNGPVTFRIGDLQAHRYTNTNAMNADSLTPEEAEGLNKIDSAHNIIFEHWDHENQKFKHPAQIEMEKE
jgi:hypothetical protein